MGRLGGTAIRLLDAGDHTVVAVVADFDHAMAFARLEGSDFVETFPLGIGREAALD